MIIPDSKKMASIIVAKLKPSTGEMDMHPEKEDERDPDQEGLEACAQDLLDAFEKKDAKALAMALHDFFEMCDSLPHKEHDHENEDYDHDVTDEAV